MSNALQEQALQTVCDRYDRPVMNNIQRGDYVECVVAALLGSEWTLPWTTGYDWAPWDLEHEDGTKIEVKQSAARQTWNSRDSIPPRERQETLTELVRHYEELGKDRMRAEVFGVDYYSPGTRVRKSDNVLHCAEALRSIGIETIQDVRDQCVTRIKGALCSIHGIGERTAHMLLMYCGREEFVKGDVHVRNFVSQALGGTKVEAEEAERLVADAAHAMGLPPRVLDAHIWESRAQRGTREHTAGYCRHASHGRGRKGKCNEVKASLVTCIELFLEGVAEAPPEVGSFLLRRRSPCLLRVKLATLTWLPRLRNNAHQALQFTLQSSVPAHSK